MPKELPVERKYSLMLRDPLVHKLDEKHKQWRKNCFDETLTNEVDQLKKDVRKKWNAGIYWPETTLQGVTDFWLPTSSVYEAVEDVRETARSKGHVFIDKDGKLTFLDVNGLVYCPPHKIPIIIDPTILTLHDGETVKEVVWDIIKAEIEKRKDTSKSINFPDDLVDFLPIGYIEEKKTIKGRKCAVPAKEPDALAAVFRCHTETFIKYLRWYDLKMKGGLPFRLIALIEFHSKPEDREQKFAEHINRREKVKIRKRVKGESTIKAGFDMIYRAIERKSTPTQEDQIPTMGEKYDCPDHGRECPEGCVYLDRWYLDFDNKNKMPSLKEKLSSFQPVE